MPEYDLQSLLKNHCGNDRNHFLAFFFFFFFFFVILGIDWLAMVYSNVICYIKYMFFIGIFNTTLFYHVHLIICNTEVNQSTKLEYWINRKKILDIQMHCFGTPHILEGYICSTLSKIIGHTLILTNLPFTQTDALVHCTSKRNLYHIRDSMTQINILNDLS